MYHKGGRDHFWLRLSFDPHLATVDCSSFNLKPGPSGPSRGVHDPQWDEDGGAGEHVVELHGASGERRLRASTRGFPGFEAGAVKLLATGKRNDAPRKVMTCFLLSLTNSKMVASKKTEMEFQGHPSSPIPCSRKVSPLPWGQWAAESEQDAGVASANMTPAKRIDFLPVWRHI